MISVCVLQSVVEFRLRDESCVGCFLTLKHPCLQQATRSVKMKKHLLVRLRTSAPGDAATLISMICTRGYFLSCVVAIRRSLGHIMIAASNDGLNCGKVGPLDIDLPDLASKLPKRFAFRSLGSQNALHHPRNLFFENGTTYGPFGRLLQFCILSINRSGRYHGRISCRK